MAAVDDGRAQPGRERRPDQEGAIVRDVLNDPKPLHPCQRVLSVGKGIWYMKIAKYLRGSGESLDKSPMAATARATDPGTGRRICVPCLRVDIVAGLLGPLTQALRFERHGARPPPRTLPRARSAIRNADYGVGIEAGLFWNEDGKDYLDVRYCASYIPRI